MGTRLASTRSRCRCLSEHHLSSRPTGSACSSQVGAAVTLTKPEGTTLPRGKGQNLTKGGEKFPMSLPKWDTVVSQRKNLNPSLPGPCPRKPRSPLPPPCPGRHHLSRALASSNNSPAAQIATVRKHKAICPKAQSHRQSPPALPCQIPSGPPEGFLLRS